MAILNHKPKYYFEILPYVEKLIQHTVIIMFVIRFMLVLINKYFEINKSYLNILVAITPMSLNVYLSSKL